LTGTAAIFRVTFKSVVEQRTSFFLFLFITLIEKLIVKKGKLFFKTLKIKR